MRGRIRTALVITLGVALGAVLLTPVTSQAAGLTAPTSPYSAITEDRQDTSSSTDTVMSVYDPSNATVTATPYSGGVDMHATSTTGAPSIDIAVGAPTSQTLAAGTYNIIPIADSTHGTMSVIDGSPSCTVQSGTVTVTAVTFAAGAVTTFAATYDVQCQVVHLSGELRFQSTTGYVGESLTADAVDWDNLYVGQMTPIRTYTLTSLGSDPLDVSDVTLGGDDPDAFVTGDDTCTGADLAFGETCTIEVAGRPTTGATQTAELTFADNSASAQQIAVLVVGGLDSEAGSYAPVDPSRVLDTRSGVGARKGVVGAGKSVTITEPWENVSAIVLNVTVTHETSKSGYVTAYAAGATRPTASNINYVKGVTRAGNITVPVSSSGKVTLYNCCGNVDLIADVEGAYIKGPSSGSFPTKYDYFPAAPSRVLDTRDKTTWSFGALPAGYDATVPIDFGSSWRPATGAFVVNVTAVSPAASGYLTAYNSDVDPTKTSTVNFKAGVTTANLAIVPVEICHTSGCNGIPMIRIFNGSSQKTHVVVDVVGFYGLRSVDQGLRFTPLPTSRIVDTRSSLGATKFGADQQQSITAPSGVAGYDTIALATNVTAVSPTASTYLTMWPNYSGETRPDISNLNAGAGVTLANAAIPELGPNNVFNVYNRAGSLNVLVDVSGRFDVFPSENPHPFVVAKTPATALTAPGAAAPPLLKPLTTKRFTVPAPAAR